MIILPNFCRMLSLHLSLQTITKFTRTSHSTCALMLNKRTYNFDTMCSNGQSNKISTNSNFNIGDVDSDHSDISIINRRLKYKCGDAYVTLDKILPWPKFAEFHRLTNDESANSQCKINNNFNSKISIFYGDITVLEIDAIVNAANRALRGGGGVDGAIHSAAGIELTKSSSAQAPCETGQAKITKGYNLPAKFVLHTVGPMMEVSTELSDCYSNSLNLALRHNIRSIAFPCISTGIYGYPNDRAAIVALKTVRNWLQTGENAQKIDRIIFCLFQNVDRQLYAKYLMQFFPLLM